MPGGDGNLEQAVKLAALAEEAMAQADPPSPALNRELAALYTACAERELAGAGAGLEPRLAMTAAAQLGRARVLAPEYFPAANRLARLQIEQRQGAKAPETLRDFLGTDVLPEHRAQAAALLSPR